ncbi:MAG: DUF1360 domain-containing protein [Planctomycetaceae bacterium]|jgi:hypothetical protein|nr:DUF1360 domain-containing protein [Planctomycetaceae bacterium]
MLGYEFGIFCMAAVGLTAILVDGKIFQPLRERLEKNVRDYEERWNVNFKDLKPPRTWSGFFFSIITCYQCCGFWSGLFCGAFPATCNLILVFEMPRPIPAIVFRCFCVLFFWLLCGFAGSFLSTVYLMFVEWIFAKTELCRRTRQEYDAANFHEHSHESDEETAKEKRYLAGNTE